NPRLRDAMAEARANNMPRDNIERAIKRGTGEMEGVTYEQVLYEGYGPGGAALLIECLTDNRNRTVADLRALLVRNNASLAEAGSVAWLFSKKGFIDILKTELHENKLMELAIDAGAEDFNDSEDTCGVLTQPDMLETVKSVLENRGISLQSTGHTLIPTNTIELKGETAEKMLKLIELLEEMDDVQKVHSNCDINDC
ncbi:MAG: YebC/PmpR family DNA-binding transcriptional regulator, partial [Bdellovibrionota bacterium]